MRQWEIYNFPYPSEDNPHPCVIFSPDGIADHPAAPAVNVLACTGQKPGDRLRPGEFILTTADGLEKPTILKCTFILVFPKNLAGKKRGQVCYGHLQPLKNLLAHLYGIYFK